MGPGEETKCTTGRSFNDPYLAIAGHWALSNVKSVLIFSLVIYASTEL